MVLRSRLTDSTSFIDFALGIRATAKAAVAHSDVSFECLVEELDLEPQLARAMVMCEPPAEPFAVYLTVLIE